MNFLSRILKKILKKENSTKLIDVPIEKTQKEESVNFANSLKPNEAKSKIETLTCVGDGLGIQSKIVF